MNNIGQELKAALMKALAPALKPLLMLVAHKALDLLAAEAAKTPNMIDDGLVAAAKLQCDPMIEKLVESLHVEGA